MSVRWCVTHDVGWFTHERDDTCESRRLPDAPTPADGMSPSVEWVAQQELHPWPEDADG